MNFIFIVLIFILIITGLVFYSKHLTSIVDEDNDIWDANKTKEETDIHKKVKVNEEIVNLMNRIKLASKDGKYHIWVYPTYSASEETLEYFRSKNYKVEELDTRPRNIEISWRNNNENN